MTICLKRCPLKIIDSFNWNHEVFVGKYEELSFEYVIVSGMCVY